MKKTKLVRDTVHGYVKVPSGYFNDFIDTALFQRLRGIEQTSIRVLYPSAHHDRFIHSLGTFHLAQAVFQSLDERGQLEDIRSKEHLQHSFQIAALLHDCAHSPFSHIGEGFTKRLFPTANKAALLNLANDESFSNDFADVNATAQNSPAPHEVASALVVLRRFKDAIQDNWANPLLVVRMITGCKYLSPKDRQQQIENCLIELVNGPTLDVDKLDYILRDTWASGVKNASVDIDRLIAALVFTKGEDDSLCVALSKTALSVIQNMVQARDFLYQWIVCHHKVVYEKHLLEKAISDLGRALDEKFELGTPDDCLRPLFSVDALLSRQGIGQGLSAYLPSDGDIRFLLKQYCSESDAAKQLLERSHSQRPAWKTFSEFSHHFRRELSPQDVGSLEQNVARFSSQVEEEVARNGWGTYCKVSPKLSMSKLAKMRIVIEEGKDPCAFNEIFGASVSPVFTYFYLFLSEGVDSGNVIIRLKSIAQEAATAPL